MPNGKTSSRESLLSTRTKTSGPHCVPAPRSIAAFANVPAGHGGEFRWSGLFFAMIGKEFTKHKVKDPTAYRAQLDKSALMKVMAALVSSSALPQHGKSALYTQEPRQQKNLASKIGFKCRESFSRNLRRSPRMLTKQFKKAAKACIYKFAFNQGEASGHYVTGSGYKMPRAKEMSQHPQFGDYWRDLQTRLQELKKAGAFADYAWIPGWLFDANLNAGPLDRLVMLVLAFHGLLAIDEKTGRMKKEFVQLSYGHIAGCLGIHRDTVARCVNFWKSIHVLSVEEQPGHWTLNGAKIAEYVDGAMWTQEYNKIWYLPGKEFNEVRAQEEIERFKRVSAHGGAGYSKWWDAADEAHAATVKAFMGQRKTLGSFWLACWSAMRGRGVPDDYIRTLIPRPPG
jgi:hypothetical protein